MSNNQLIPVFTGQINQEQTSLVDARLEPDLTKSNKLGILCYTRRNYLQLRIIAPVRFAIFLCLLINIKSWSGVLLIQYRLAEISRAILLVVVTLLTTLLGFNVTKNKGNNHV